MTRFIGTLLATAVATTGLLVGAAAPASAAPASAPVRADPAAGAIRVATYNICKTSCGRGRFGWAKRRIALVNAVRAADPDVLAIQEANTAVWRGSRQIDDVRARLAEIGYRIASTDFDNCPRGCTRGAHIFFRPERLQLASPPGEGVPAAGMVGMSTIAGTDFGGIQDRNVSWAFLTPLGSTRTTLYVSVHLPTQKNAHAERLRVAVARGLRPWADALIRGSGLGEVALVVAGDLNSFQRRQPNGAQSVLADAGLIDGYEAPERVNASFSTVNYQPKVKRFKGFPPRPFRYGPNPAPARIDYVLATVSPLRHEVVLKLRPSGAFDNDFRASDHNMVMVDLPLR